MLSIIDIKAVLIYFCQKITGALIFGDMMLPFTIFKLLVVYIS